MSTLANPSEFENKISAIKKYLLNCQNSICNQLESLDNKEIFVEDRWQSSLGEGRTRILTNGTVFEKAGINFSHVSGDALPPAAIKGKADLADAHFEALGLSLVTHPLNPYVPTVHLNVRFFMAQPPGKTPYWWFGGGMDLTPYYGFVEDCQHWHATSRQACLPFGDDLYSRYKKWCDDYFYLKHRNEPRGIGGLFFDELNEWDFETCFAFMRSVGDHFIKAYSPIVTRRCNHDYSEKETWFQHYRRGRYVEFNLVFDRGTLFGLQSNGRTESILMSLPPKVVWAYNWKPEPGSEEARLYSEFLVKKDW